MNKTFLLGYVISFVCMLAAGGDDPRFGNRHISDLNPLGSRAERLHARAVVTTPL